MNHVYYPIKSLTRDGYPVFFPIASIKLRSGEQMEGTEVVGLKKTYRKGQASERTVYRVRRADISYEDLPEFMYPTLFRPLNLKKYPDPLPERATLTGDVAWGSAHPPITEPDDPLHLEWPRSYAFPPDISHDEVEVRIMRALKTERAKGVDDQGLHGPAYKIFADVLVGLQGGGSITVKGWVPDKRDIGDWLLVREWLRRIGRTERGVIELKSLDFSFRQIGDRSSRSGEWARQAYEKGIDQALGVANGR